jgi:hypothetical protein
MTGLAIAEADPVNSLLSINFCGVVACAHGHPRRRNANPAYDRGRDGHHVGHDQPGRRNRRRRLAGLPNSAISPSGQLADAAVETEAAHQFFLADSCFRPTPSGWGLRRRSPIH